MRSVQGQIRALYLHRFYVQGSIFLFLSGVSLSVQFISASIAIGMVWVAAMNPDTGRTVFHFQPSTNKDGDKRKKNTGADKRYWMSYHRKAEFLQDFLDLTTQILTSRKRHFVSAFQLSNPPFQSG